MLKDTKTANEIAIENNWIKDYKISLPVRLHDSRSIKKYFNETFQELHLLGGSSLGKYQCKL